MIPISTVYRFYTPFSNIENERKILIKTLEKIKLYLQNENIIFVEEKIDEWDYIKVSLIFEKDLWKLNFFFLKTFKNIWYMPVFFLNIKLNKNFLIIPEQKKYGVNFLTSVFECFDWLDEKEYLIDSNSLFYYTDWFLLKSKHFPHSDFKNIDEIEKIFDSSKWQKTLENFILKFKDSKFILSSETSSEYHEVHSIALYLIYLVYLMSKNKENSEKLNQSMLNLEYEYKEIFELNKKRFSYVKSLHNKLFEQYKQKLEIFFKMF